MFITITISVFLSEINTETGTELPLLKGANIKMITTKNKAVALTKGNCRRLRKGYGNFIKPAVSIIFEGC